MNQFAKLTSAVSVPWNAFVAAFLYYSLLASLALGGASPAGATVAGAYAVPPVIYTATLLLRLLRAGVAWVKAERASGLAPTAHSAA